MITNIINSRLINFLITSICSIIFLNLLSYHIEILNFPYQLEYREVVPLIITKGFENGILPYNINQQPYHADLYGLIYPLVALPFTKVFGINLFTFRLISFFAIIISTLYFYFTLKKNKVNTIISYLLTVLLYSILLFQYTPICRQDGLGFLFFALSILIPYNYSFSLKSLLFSAILSVLAFHTKIYFFIGFPIILTYIFLFKSIKTSILIFSFYTLIFGIFIVIISYKFDYYYIGTFFNQLSSTSYDYDHMVNQTYFFFFKAFPIITIIICFIFFNKYQFIKQRLLDKSRLLYNNELIISYNININDGLIKNYQSNYFTYLFFSFLILLTIKMGGHNGNFLLYYLHLLSIPFLIIVSLFLKKSENYNLVYKCLILISILIFMKNIPMNGKNQETIKNFKKIKYIIENSNNILNNPSISSICLELNKPVLNSGLTETFISGEKFRYSGNLIKPIAMIKDKIYLKTINKVIPVNNKYINNIHKNIKEKKYDFIFSDQTSYDDWLVNDSLLLANNYKPFDSLKINMYSTFQKWKIIIWKK